LKKEFEKNKKKKTQNLLSLPLSFSSPGPSPLFSFSQPAIQRGPADLLSSWLVSLFLLSPQILQATGLLSLARVCGLAPSPRGPRSSPWPSSSQLPASPFISLSPADRSGPHVRVVPYLQHHPARVNSAASQPPPDVSRAPASFKPPSRCIEDRPSSRPSIPYC
jgi:hypothetical protein